MESKKKFWLGVLTGACGMMIVVIVACAIIFSNVSSTSQISSFATEDEGLGDETLDIATISKNISLLESTIDENFILDYNKSDLEQGIYKGLIEALGDPYSEYYTAEEAAELEATLSGTYAGIGATVSEDVSGNVVILKIIKDSPAEDVGLKSGDIIIGIDYESVSGLTTDEVVELVRGEEGTTFTLNITRDGERLDFDITRAYVNAEQVSYDIKDDIGYISINQFVGTAAEETKETVATLQSEGVTKLIIDLRNNVGGTLDVLLEISDYFLDEGEVIIKEVDKKGNENIHYASSEKIFDGEIVILTNEYTASAAESFTAALHDNGKATVVGTTTYGKGIVQQSVTLSSGAILKLTTEYYYTPNDVCIHKVGITPDYVLEYDASSGTDNQVAKALELLE